MPKTYELPKNCLNVLISPNNIEDTCSLLDFSKKTQDENVKIYENKYKYSMDKRNPGINNSMIHKSSSHIPNNKSVNYSARKYTLLKPIDKPESFYENMINSLGVIRHSTPPFVHVNQDSLQYDPISKSYIS